MADVIAKGVLAAGPAWMGPCLAVVMAFFSIPFTFFISNDAFHFGVVPILARAAAVHGISAAGIGRAAIGGVDLSVGKRVRNRARWPPALHADLAITVALVMLLASVLFGVIPFIGRIHWKAYNAVFAALAKPEQASQDACPAGMFAWCTEPRTTAG